MTDATKQLTREQYAAETPEQTTARIMAERFGNAMKKYVKTAIFDEGVFREKLPPEMLTARRWMRYYLKQKADGGTSKIPIGDMADESTWSTFDECVAAIENQQQGLGYAFYKGEIEAVDVRHCRNPKTGVICKEVMLLMERLKPSWAEYSVSGKGIHLLGYDSKGIRHRKPITETCLQSWPSQHSARFFAITCQMVGGAADFNKFSIWNGQTNYVYSDAKRISAKIREELKEVDYEQWAALPDEHEPIETVSRERAKTKTRTVAAGFDIKDFLAFYGLPIMNETDNELGHCIRLTVCLFHDCTPHANHNATSTNFIYPSKDGGLGFKCQSSGCSQSGIHDVIKQLAEDKGPYPKPIYENFKPGTRKLFLSTSVMSKVASLC